MAFKATATKKIPKVNNKRIGKHRKHSQKYLRHYWPYLPLLGIVMTGLLCSMLWPQGSNILGAQSDLTATSLLTQTNQQRGARQEPDLTLSNELTQAAQSKALDMAAGNYWSHDTPDGATPWSFITKAGYNYSKAGENLAYGFSDANTAVTAWMNSPEHRANILDSGYSQVGFGIASSPDYIGKGAETIIVAMYARPVPTGLAAPGAESGEVKGSEIASRPIARVALLGNSAASSATVVVLLAMSSLAVMIFIARHARFLHKSLVRGEVFVVHHLTLDILIVMVATGGYVLTRTAGFVL